MRYQISAWFAGNVPISEVHQPHKPHQTQQFLHPKSLTTAFLTRHPCIWRNPPRFTDRGLGGDTIGCLSMCIYTVYCIAAVGVCINEHVCMHIYIYIYISLWKQSTCQRSVHSTKKNCSLVPPFGPSQWPQVHVLSAPCNAGVSAKHHETSTISNWTFQWLRQILQKTISM